MEFTQSLLNQFQNSSQDSPDYHLKVSQISNQLDKMLRTSFKSGGSDLIKMLFLQTGLTERPQQFPKWGPNFDGKRLMDMGILCLQRDQAVGSMIRRTMLNG
jgi:hypothetical protein